MVALAAAQVGLPAGLVMEPPTKDLMVAHQLATLAVAAAGPALLVLMRSVVVLVALVVLVLPHLLQVRLFLEQAEEELLPILRLHLPAVLVVVVQVA
jgi:predicted cobalt transporter CbtA